MTQQQQQELRDMVRLDVARGAITRDEIIEEILTYFGRFPVEAILLAQITDEELASHAREQANWDGPTDCDLLDRAFADLEKSGIVARQDFTCCGTCGVAEIGDDVDDINAKEGYVFYHMQDTESAIEGSDLCFNYGAFEDNDAQSLAVGHRVVEALRAVGLKPQWSGEITRRVSLPLKWKKRRNFSAAAK